MKNTAFIVITLLLILSCSKKESSNITHELDCSNVLPPPNWFEIFLVNSSGKGLVGSVYTQDSFRLYNNSFEQFIRLTQFGNPKGLQIFYPDIESGVPYFIQLDSLDSDTLKFNYSIINGECFDSFKMDSIQYNGNTVSNTIIKE